MIEAHTQHDFLARAVNVWIVDRDQDTTRVMPAGEAGHRHPANWPAADPATHNDTAPTFVISDYAARPLLDALGLALGQQPSGAALNETLRIERGRVDKLLDAISRSADRP